MKTKMIAAALLAAGLTAPVLAKPAPIERLTTTMPDGKPGAILKGVIVPAGYETFYLSGQLPDPIDPAKRATVEDFGDTKTQTISTLAKIKTILAEKGYAMSYMAGFLQFFNTAENPNTLARSTFQVAGLVSPVFLVEFEVTAVKAPK